MRRRFIQNSLKGFDFDNYLTVEALEDNLIVSMSATLEYCINGDNKWKVLSKNDFTESINTGEVISFRGELFPEIAGRGIGTFVINKRCNIKGNCMSLIFKDDAKYNFNLPSVWGMFFELFKNCTTIINASDLILQATGLAPSCYSNMFYGCYNLEHAPKLPATELYNSCYESMFKKCSNLMIAPELLAPVLVTSCYANMFYECTKLNYIKMLATDISAPSCLRYWTTNVASSGTFVKHPEATWDVVGDSGVPYRWTVKFDGEEDVELLEFTVDGVAYQFEEGMTWADWCDSSYNTVGFTFYLSDAGYAVYTSDLKKYFITNLNPNALVKVGVYETNKVDWPMPK